jgi:hypothetical protein
MAYDLTEPYCKRAEAAKWRLAERDRQDVLAAIAAVEAAAAAKAKVQRDADQLARDAEIDAQSDLLLDLTDPSNESGCPGTSCGQGG